MQLFFGLQAAVYTLAAISGLVNCPFYQDYLASQAEQEPPAVVETVDAPELTQDRAERGVLGKDEA